MRVELARSTSSRRGKLRGISDRLFDWGQGTYSSVAPSPSSYTISLDKDLNLSIDFFDSLPNRISFNISINAEIQTKKKGKLSQCRKVNDSLFRTFITLPKHLGEVKRPFNSLIPQLSFECEFRLVVSFRHGGKLEEVTRDNYL
jgi:hypothetical protein